MCVYDRVFWMSVKVGFFMSLKVCFVCQYHCVYVSVSVICVLVRVCIICH